MKKQQNEYIELDGIKIPVPLTFIKNSEWRKFNANVKHISQELSNDIRSKYEKELAQLKGSEQ